MEKMAEDRIGAALTRAQNALDQFARGPAQDAADAIGAAFDRAGDRIAGALTRAAGDGEDAFKRLAKTILEEFATLALDRVFGSPGAAAPAPSAPAGGFASAAAAPVTVNFQFAAGADAASVKRNQAQIAAQVARAAAYGRRNL
jgi:hypothetical protein